MTLSLPYGRILILPDEGEDSQGTIVESNCDGYRALQYPLEYDEDGKPIFPDPLEHNHIIYTKENVTEVEIEGVTHVILHVNSVVGFLD